MKIIYKLTGLVAFVGIASANPIVTFSLTPSDGILAGAAGTSVGWGYTVSTDTSFVTIESITFGDLTPIGVFSTPGVPLSGASPGSPITTSWIPDIAGLQYDIANNAIFGASTQGVMTVVYDAFNDAGLTDQFVFGDSVNAQQSGNDVIASVTVNGPSAATPEPGSIVLLVGGLAVVALRSKRLARS